MAAEADLREKYFAILENEKEFTAHVAREVIDKPQLSLWMILIPVFFVFYYFQFKRYRDGVKIFKKEFIKTRKRVLEAVYQTMEDDRQVNIEKLVAASDAPEQARPAYGAWVNELVVFYRSLMEAEGNDYRSLVQSCYREQSNFLIALNRLNTIERNLHRALLPHLENPDEQTTSTVASIEKSSADFRRNQAMKVFSR